MSGARDTILARIRATRTARFSAPSRAVVPLPRIGDDIVGDFVMRATHLSSDVLGPIPPVQVCAEIARYLNERGLPRSAVCWPELAALDWGAQGLTVSPRAARGEDLVGLTGAFCAVAETGSLMLLSQPDAPTSVSLLPETHIAVLPIGRIVPRMEDAWALLRRERGRLPRAVNFVSGPSRTADIEQTVTLGAHGPYRVCIVLTHG